MWAEAVVRKERTKMDDIQASLEFLMKAYRCGE